MVDPSEQFRWLEGKRIECIHRIVLTIKCLGWDMDTAVRHALAKSDGIQFTYCRNPDRISDLQFHRLKQDAEAYLEHLNNSVDKPYERRPVYEPHQGRAGRDGLLFKSTGALSPNSEASRKMRI
ncbi:hypothetical protein [Gordoniibacillus kamchatkensis]|uniref:hypothetical protein n=1 Tax=Gordoniibacillus kamchatkensis TaxID=1590651 RepID=UPI0012E0A15A|nr:hypothetical protein [Paenibacillus sp. VKM B-2647]